jgi:hypothetical protein
MDESRNGMSILSERDSRANSTTLRVVLGEDNYIVREASRRCSPAEPTWSS